MALTKIKTSGIADNAITNAKMADDAIDSADFADGSIDNVHVATGLDAVKLADGTVTNTEFQYINTLSSNAQTQISAALPKAGGTMTGDLIISENDPNIRMVDTNTSSYSQLTNTNGSLKIEADLGAGSGSSTLEFTVDNSTKMLIDSSGKVGIGTTSPDSHLDISGAGAQRLTIQSTDNDSVDIYLQRGSTTDGHGDFSLNNDSGVFKVIGHASSTDTTALTITGAGNVGIGEASPETRVHITGAGGGGESALMLEDSTGSSNTKKLRMYVNNDLGYIDAPNDAFNSAVDIVNFNLSNATTTFAGAVVLPANEGVQFGDSAEVIYGTGSYLITQSSANIYIKTNGSTTALTLDTSQNATFAGKVKLNGASNADATLSLKAHNNGWDGGLTMESADGSFTIQVHPENGTTYGLMFDQKLYVVGDVSATSFTDRTPYPETLKIAYDVLASHKRLDDYDKNDKEKQLDHSKLHEYAKAEHGRDVSAVISCLVETVNDLTAKVIALENA